MSDTDSTEMSANFTGTTDLEQRLRDYVKVSKKLFWQRQAIYVAVALMTTFYINPRLVILCYPLILFSEMADVAMNWFIDKWSDHSPRKARKFLYWVIGNTVLSAGSMCFFILLSAFQQPKGFGHFSPLFFMFAASLFAAMNNHQLKPALFIRLGLYGLTFLSIALMDILPNPPVITSQSWLQFFTTMFVLYFITDTSLVFLRLYRKTLKQLDDLRVEHEKTTQAYEVKTKFLSTVSHELRTPLTSIKASVDLVNSGVLGTVPEKIMPILQIAGKNSKRLADLINDLLDVQKIEAGEMVYHFAPVNLRALVLESIEANQGFADQLGVGIVADFPEADAYVSGDEARLMQVMANLLSNAMKFSHKGNDVRVAVLRLNGRVRISVKDTGTGIAPGSRELVFGKFTQIDNSDQRRVGGTGLGMHITKQIVDKHNGHIDFDSVIGQGTTFYVEFDEKKPGRASNLASASAGLRAGQSLPPGQASAA